MQTFCLCMYSGTSILLIEIATPRFVSGGFVSDYTAKLMETCFGRCCIEVDVAYNFNDGFIEAHTNYTSVEPLELSVCEGMSLSLSLL